MHFNEALQHSNKVYYDMQHKRIVVQQGITKDNESDKRYFALTLYFNGNNVGSWQPLTELRLRQEILSEGASMNHGWEPMLDDKTQQETIQGKEETIEDIANNARQHKQCGTRFLSMIGSVNEKIMNDDNNNENQYIIEEAMQKQRNRDKTAFFRMAGALSLDNNEEAIKDDVDIDMLRESDKETLRCLMRIVENLRFGDVIDAIGEGNGNAVGVVEALVMMRTKLRR